MAAVRRRTIARELEGKVRFVRRCYLLLPGENQRPTYDAYVIAHRMRAKQLAPELPFAVPELGHPYPSSSLPAQVLALHVDARYPERSEALEDQLFRAMFSDLANVGSPAVLKRCAAAAGVPAGEVDEALADPALAERAFAEHDEGLSEGVSGIPALLVPGEGLLTGAVPLPQMRAPVAAALELQSQA